jgi:hypothetical protein
MSTLIDVLGSVVIAGVVILAVITLTSNTTSTMYEKSSESTTLSNLASIVEVFDFDLQKVGYGAQPPIILRADSNAIEFRADVDRNGIVDTVKYSLGGTSGLSGTTNPNDRILYRQLNTGPKVGSSLGVINFSIVYYDKSGAVTNDPASVRSFLVKLRVQSTYPIDSTYADAYWEKRYFPVNLNLK